MSTFGQSNAKVFLWKLQWGCSHKCLASESFHVCSILFTVKCSLKHWTLQKHQDWTLTIFLWHPVHIPHSNSAQVFSCTLSWSNHGSLFSDLHYNKWGPLSSALLFLCAASVGIIDRPIGDIGSVTTLLAKKCFNVQFSQMWNVKVVEFENF